MKYRNNTQEQRLKYVFNSGIFTMKHVSVKTEIDRANICRFIANLRKSNSVYLVRKGICPITKSCGVGFYTANFALYLSFKTVQNGK